MLVGLEDIDSDYSLIQNNSEIFKFFKNFSDKTNSSFVEVANLKIPYYINEFWTSQQRKANSIHEISYRACFKAQLPNFFIKLLTKKGDVVYDPFAGRGTSLIEAALLQRNIIANDINPISQILTKARLKIPNLNDLLQRLEKVKNSEFNENLLTEEIDLSMFYHQQTFKEILKLKYYLKDRKEQKQTDEIDNWISMIATNRLTGHSSGFFSVYTLPPNQAVSAKRQQQINLKRNQIPPYRNVNDIILKKTKTLLRNIEKSDKKNLENAAKNALFLEKQSFATSEIQENSVDLIVTSPPFLNIVNYADDNWLRCWFNDIDLEEIKKNISVYSKLEDWCNFIEKTFIEFKRILKEGAFIAFEVGEVRNGKIDLEKYVAEIGIKLGFKCLAIIINSQQFTKTANIWGIKNNKIGTNSNRIILFSNER